ncbi:protein NEGATIVE GRAVITROPIC RESPONSE OF ROOTS-like [Zingiber officinale]|uniref:protein NEGATIVE GRAVITROPIC RESPONSE OF ROOTS-like n=1 Tax=Zingiber officinale TaxID=94328 RepID=UPI001C4D4641|nr:protein NEGATIVE GRAVITROPIC RESPONSE OF ROOTS-like [Zingiber officinale]XP_042468451.1 protein NEGATIVE GRAVITROPIC RESPONSE OF ROOTS-like [Zingiber officinale]
MRIFSWVQNKFNGRQEKKRFDAGMSSARYDCMPDTLEEQSEQPRALLSIGTFGNNELKEEPQRDDQPPNLDSSGRLSDFTVEDVNKLQKELKKLLSRKSKSKSKSKTSVGSEMGEEDRANLPLDRFLNCPSSLEVNRTATVNNGDLSPNTKLILYKLKDVLLGNHNPIKKKSISFLLEKMFMCGSGFAPAPSLRDPIIESRMDKILRAILTKTICQHCSAPIPPKKYLENTPQEQAHKEDEECRRKSKWVKTDSEFIVLEI